MVGREKIAQDVYALPLPTVSQSNCCQSDRDIKIYIKHT